MTPADQDQRAGNGGPVDGGVPKATTDMLATARDLVARGFSVFPLDHPDDTWVTNPDDIGKAPAIRWKPFQATRPTDADLVLWFGNGRKRNAAMVTGAISNVVLVDGDSAEGLAWMRAHLPATEMRTKTAKGEHWAYRHPGVPIKNKVRIKTGNPEIKVDVRGDGGYGVTVGSLHHKRVAYVPLGTWPPVSELPVFDPAWLEPDSDSDPTLASTPPVAETVAEGSRNDSLFREGCRLRHLGWAEPEIYEALLTLNRTRCTPPLDDAEVQTIARSAASYEAGGPAGDDPYPETDSGNAEFFAAVTGADRVRYDHARRLWFVFNGHHFRHDRDGEVDRLALDAVRERQTRALGISDSDRRTKRLKWAARSESRSGRDSLIKLAASHATLAVTGDCWDAAPGLLGVTNGVIDLERGTLRDGRPADNITRVAAVAFDPAARCPRWERFLREVFDDAPEIADYLQLVFGYSLTGHTMEQVFWILFGEGANGKSTLMETFMRAVLGPDYTWTMPFPAAGWSNAMSEYQKASLVGQRLVAASEVSCRGELNEELIKNLTGDDMINARHPYGRPFTFIPNAKFFLRVNDKPIIRDQSHGMWRRVKLVPFMQTFAVNPKLGDELRAEAAGILAWAVRGCVDWHRGGLQHPDVVNAATADYQEEAHPLAEFYDERCVMTPNASVGARELFDEYRRWCDSHQVREVDRLSQRTFGPQIRTRFEVREGRTVTYLGIGLRAEREEGPEL